MKTQVTHHILAINETISTLFRRLEQLKSEGHIPRKSMADKSMLKLKIAAANFRNEVLKRTS